MSASSSPVASAPLPALELGSPVVGAASSPSDGATPSPSDAHAANATKAKGKGKSKGASKARKAKEPKAPKAPSDGATETDEAKPKKERKPRVVLPPPTSKMMYATKRFLDTQAYNFTASAWDRYRIAISGGKRSKLSLSTPARKLFPKVYHAILEANVRRAVQAMRERVGASGVTLQSKDVFN
jgi:hypothetical protein